MDNLQKSRPRSSRGGWSGAQARDEELVCAVRRDLCGALAVIPDPRLWVSALDASLLLTARLARTVRPDEALTRFAEAVRLLRKQENP